MILDINYQILKWETILLNKKIKQWEMNLLEDKSNIINV